jgi:phosphatidylserine/phosphatidylglycerophosphate/cardiolipin synthase-like enzyme
MTDRQSDQIHLVITAPESEIAQMAYEVGARTTLGVLTMLVAQAQKELVIAAPFVQEDEALNKEPLSGALRDALERGVAVNIASTRSGLRALSVDYLTGVTRKYIRFFQATANINNDVLLGSHAKFCIADSKRAYIGSANLTRPGMLRNFEMGDLVSGAIAYKVRKIWRYLVEEDYFTEVGQP